MKFPSLSEVGSALALSASLSACSMIPLNPDAGVDAAPGEEMTDGGVAIQQVAAVLDDTKKEFERIAREGTKTSTAEEAIYRVVYDDPVVPENVEDKETFPRSHAMVTVEHYGTAQNGIRVTTYSDHHETIRSVRVEPLSGRENTFQLQYGVSECDLSVSDDEPKEQTDSGFLPPPAYISSRSCNATGVSGFITVKVGSQNEKGGDVGIVEKEGDADAAAGAPIKLEIESCDYEVSQVLDAAAGTSQFVSVYGDDMAACIATFKQVNGDLLDFLEAQGLHLWLKRDWTIEKQ